MTIAQKRESTLMVGGSSSLGAVIASGFSGNGHYVVSTYMSNVSIDQTNINVCQLDLSSAQSIDAFHASMVHQSYCFDNVIFLSSIIPGNNLQDYREDHIDQVLSVNFSGQAKLLKKIIPLLSSEATVLMFASISAQRGSYDPIYAASKGAVLSFVKSMATQMPDGTRINAIAPGLIQDSFMYDQMEVGRQNHHRQASPLGELLRVTDLAKIMYDLCQPHWRHLNGACIDLNGGAHVR